MTRKPTCECLQEAAEYNCLDVDFFYERDTEDVTIDCTFFNPTSGVQEDIELLWNFCPQCGKEFQFNL